MKLYHVSEESDIAEFIPRTPKRDDVDKSKGLVWALNELGLTSFLLPRDCPRVTYYANEKTTEDDVQKYFSSAARHVVAIESAWFQQTATTSIYVYEFDTASFCMQDEVAGYYVSEQAQTPLSVTRLDNLFDRLFERNVEVRILPNLWQLGEAVQKTTLGWGLYRMINAQPKPTI